MLTLAIGFVLLIIYFLVKKNFYSETLVGFMLFSVIALLIELYASIFPIPDGGAFMQLVFAELIGAFSLIFIITDMFSKSDQNEKSDKSKNKMIKLWIAWAISSVIIIMGIYIPAKMSDIKPYEGKYKSSTIKIAEIYEKDLLKYT